MECEKRLMVKHDGGELGEAYFRIIKSQQRHRGRWESRVAYHASRARHINRNCSYPSVMPFVSLKARFSSEFFFVVL